MADKSIEINFPHISQWMNPKFKQLFTCKDRYISLIGGRGSGKSAAISKMIVIRLLKDDFFRIIAYRKTYNTLIDSCFKNLVDDIKFFGLESLFQVTKSPLSIKCKYNDNCVYFRGGDQVGKIKSIKEATALWVEEDVFDTYDDFVTVDSSLRSLRADSIQTYFTINPIFEGDFTQHWFYNYFEYPTHSGMDFRTSKNIEVDGVLHTQTLRSIHSTFRDNNFITSDFISQMELLRTTDPYLYQINNLGIFARKITDGQFWKGFDITKNATDNVKYDSSLPLHISIDFNVNPGLHAAIFQVVGKNVTLIDEIRMVSPNNNTKDLCLKICSKYSSHESGMYIYGDASGRHQDTRSEKGWNDYTIVLKELEKYRPSLRVPPSNPPIVMRKDWINEIFKTNLGGIDVKIFSKCYIMMDDLLYAKEAPDGTTHKEKVKNKETGVTYEKYHHMGDAFAYFMCSCFSSEFSDFKSGGNKFNPTMGNSPNKYSW